MAVPSIRMTNMAEGVLSPGTYTAQIDSTSKQSVGDGFTNLYQTDDLEKQPTFSANCAQGDVPNEASSVYSTNHNVGYTELTGHNMAIPTADDIFKTWQMNYHEASIYLEEGENNDKFDFHPHSRDALPAYLIVHNHWFHVLDLMSAFLLLALALVEKPAVPGFGLVESIHASLELLALLIVGAELSLKLRWMGIRPFLQHKRTMIKLTTLVIMLLEAVVVLIRQDSHFRVTRALRPVFVIDNYYCGGVRRVIRQILQSLPPIVDMLILLFFFMLIFSVLGFYLFSWNPDDEYFASLPKSFISLFVLLTTANYPDVMMPSYSKSRWAAIFFIIFLIIHLYFFMNLMLAVVYETFTRIEKDKFRKLLLHRRKACQHCFRLLVSRQNALCITFKHFEGLMRFYKPRASRLDVFLMFKTLDTDGNGTLSLKEFYKVYEVSALNWKRKNNDWLWFSGITAPWRYVFEGIHQLVTWKWFDYLCYFIIAFSGVYQLIEAFELSRGSPNTWASIVFVALFTVEAVIKIMGLGLSGYFRSGWNKFDFCVTVASIAGVIAERYYMPFAFVVILRPLRLLRLFKLKRRYRDVMGTIFVIARRFVSVIFVIFIVYYFFAIIGMELFAGYDMTNCCKGSSVEQYFQKGNDSLTDGYYYLNNFNDILKSGVTLFELMVVNNWFIVMEGYAFVSSEWSRIYFMTFYIVTMMVVNIVIAFVLEAFLFRIQYKHQLGDMDKDSLVTVDIPLSSAELEFCYGHSSVGVRQLIRQSRERNDPICIFNGTRRRTKFSFSQKMYAEEVKEWLQTAEEEDQLRDQLMFRIPEEGHEHSINCDTHVHRSPTM